jgi:outer membrane protein OmpA-like peptidoglycan-associated protein
VADLAFDELLTGLCDAPLAVELGRALSPVGRGLERCGVVIDLVGGDWPSIQLERRYDLAVVTVPLMTLVRPWITPMRAFAVAASVMIAAAAILAVAYAINRGSGPTEPAQFASVQLDRLPADRIRDALLTGQTVTFFSDAPEELVRGLGGTKPLEEDLQDVSGSEVGSLNFALGSASISPEGARQLDQLGRALTSNALKSQPILIAGHTDSRGEPGFNQRLSELRAEAVRAYLVEHFKLDAEKLIARGFGEARLLDPGDSENAHFRNRRVEVQTVAEEEIASFRPTLEIDVDFLYLRDGEPTRMYEGIELTSRDRYQVYFKPAQDCFVYVYQQDAAGKIDQLFPNPQWTQDSPAVKAEAEYWLPGSDTYFFLDETRGTERIFVLVTRRQAQDVEDAFARLEDDKFATTEILTRSIDFRRTIEGRGVMGTRLPTQEADAMATTMDRPEKVAAADDYTIVFTFEHK